MLGTTGYSETSVNMYQTTKCHDVRGSVHHSIIHVKKSNKMQQCIKILFHIYMPIIRSLKLH